MSGERSPVPGVTITLKRRVTRVERGAPPCEGDGDNYTILSLPNRCFSIAESLRFVRKTVDTAQDSPLDAEYPLAQPVSLPDRLPPPLHRRGQACSPDRQTRFAGTEVSVCQRPESAHSKRYTVPVVLWRPVADPSWDTSASSANATSE